MSLLYYRKGLGKMRKKFINVIMCIFVLFSAFTLQVQAASIVVTGINNLKTLVVSIATEIGIIVLILGIVERVIAWQNHDSAQITESRKKIVGGLIIIGIGVIVRLIVPTMAALS